MAHICIMNSIFSRPKSAAIAWDINLAGRYISWAIQEQK